MVEASSLKAGVVMVQTLNIAGNAVTIPVHAFSAGAVGQLRDTWMTVQSATINPEGGVVSIIASVNYNVVESFTQYWTVPVRLLRNGVQIFYKAEGVVSVQKGTNAAGDIVYRSTGVLPINYKDSPGNADFTYELQVGQKGEYRNRSLLLLGTKR